MAHYLCQHLSFIPLALWCCPLTNNNKHVAIPLKCVTGVKNWGKVGEDDSDRHQNLIDRFPGHAPPLQKFQEYPFITFAQRQTDTRTATKT